MDIYSDPATQTNICGVGLVVQGRTVDCEISTGKTQRTDSKGLSPFISLSWLWLRRQPGE